MPELDLQTPAGYKVFKRSVKDKEAQGSAGGQLRPQGASGGTGSLQFGRGERQAGRLQRRMKLTIF